MSKDKTQLAQDALAIAKDSTLSEAEKLLKIEQIIAYAIKGGRRQSGK